MLKKRFILSLALITGLVWAAQPTAFAALGKEKKQATFKVRIENISDKDGLTAQDGSKYPFVLSPGFYALGDRRFRLFKEGSKASSAVEAQAEDGNPELFAKKLLTVLGGINIGVFNTPVGADMPSPILPGGTFEFEFYTIEGMKLNLATMYGQSNDLFYAPARGIDLFDANGNAIIGDVTDKFLLWDAGTEINQAPGIGSDQGPRQKGSNTGAAENGVVHLVKDGFVYPNIKDVLRITIFAGDENSSIKRVISSQISVSTKN